MPRIIVAPKTETILGSFNINIGDKEMDNILSSDRINELEIYLGLREKTPVELFYENPGRSLSLQFIPKNIQTPKMVELAVSNDGKEIKYVSKKLITEELCKTAVTQNGLALEYIPQKYISQELCEMAVEKFNSTNKYNCCAIRYVPKEQITESLAFKAVSCPIKSYFDCYPIFYIPDNIISEKLVFASVNNSPLSLKNIPDKFITKELCNLAVSLDSYALEYVPKHMRTNEICKKAFAAKPLSIILIPLQYITREMCLTVIKDVMSFSYFHSYCLNSHRLLSLEDIFNSFPNDLQNDKVILDELIQKYGAKTIIGWSLKIEPTYLSESTLKYLQSKVIEKAILQPQENPFFKLQAVKSETPPPSPEYSLVKRDDEDLCIYDFAKTEDSAIRIIYYVSDLHLEHHILHYMENQSKQSTEEGNANLENINNFLDIKLSELVQNSNINATLLVGGDVAYSIELTKLFYSKLSRMWHGSIIFILGNHELWDGHPEGKQNYVSRPIDDIVNDYREQLTHKKKNTHIVWGTIFLQNALYIIYKNRKKCIIEEMEILNASDEDLRDLCSKTSFIMLGGIGFSGENPRYNADLGLYRSAVTTLEEDKKLTQRFCSVYDKLNRCAGDMQVIVFTHNPVHDWTSKPCNPNWIYVNGHTHQNTFLKEKDGTTVLSDNQIGYEPKNWTLKGFNVSGWYDPFRNLKDGIHKITSQIYKDFNRGRGIQCNGANYPGQIYALKRNGLYMFLLESPSGLTHYLLDGGKRKKLDHNLNYYYENMETYSNIIIEAFSPYNKFLENLAEEIKHFGGRGTAHGCIVDISFYSHIYVNPYDGKMTPYFAYDVSSRLTYEDLHSLLKDKEPELTQKFLNAHEQGLTPILSEYYLTTKNIKTNNKIIPTAPNFDSGTEMYVPSRIMRSIQYIFDHNVIRNWHDELLTKNFNNTNPFLK